MPRYYFWSLSTSLYMALSEMDAVDCALGVTRLNLAPEQFSSLVAIWDAPLTAMGVAGLSRLGPDRFQVTDATVQAAVVACYLQHATLVTEPHLRLFLMWSTRNVFTGIQKMIMLSFTGVLKATMVKLQHDIQDERKLLALGPVPSLSIGGQASAEGAGQGKGRRSSGRSCGKDARLGTAAAPPLEINLTSDAMDGAALLGGSAAVDDWLRTSDSPLTPFAGGGGGSSTVPADIASDPDIMNFFDQQAFPF
jgi:hypothetical protein